VGLRWYWFAALAATIAFSPTFIPVKAAQRAPWQTAVQKYVEAGDWTAAMRVVDEELALNPQDMEVRSWRARILVWSGRPAEAEVEYQEIIKVTREDPDIWTALATLYLREGKIREAQQSIDTAVELDPKRADLRNDRARILRAAGHGKEAREEFQTALRLDPANTEARAGLLSVREEPRHELRIGQDNDLFNYTGANHDEWISLVSLWSEHWTTSAAGNFYQRGGVNATKFVASVTRRQAKWGALTAGGGKGRDRGVIPKSEAFFDLDHGWKTNAIHLVRGLELSYGQHWYWYQTSRILTLSGTGIIYFPRDWTFTVAATGARSAFSGTSAAEWRPSGVARLGFPVVQRGETRLTGNIFYAVGTENFGQVDQIGRFAAQTYGGGLRLRINSRQDVTGYAAYQKRTQGRSETSSGLSYAIHF
jgi:Flp pilus assembly protein TadD